MTAPTQVTDLTSRYPLRSAEVDSFRRDGHVRVRGLASRAELAEFGGAIASVVRRRSAQTRALADRDTYGKAFLQVCNIWRDDADVARFTLAPRFAGVAAQLLGVERVRVYHDQALFKEPGGGYTPWHQDAMYWPLDGSSCLTMWMPLVDVTPEQGGLCFASGTHVAGPLSDVRISDASEEHFHRVLAERAYRVEQPVAMAAGDATFHAGWTVHKALPNESTRMREVMTVIWFADGLAVQPPANPAQQADLAAWLPGTQPGDVAATQLNPLLPPPVRDRPV